ncbi:MAG: TRAP transporter small permease [Thermodesulfobacteriota bacterium]|nr:TRAP transporter small permease [Thermodesulfobacteriota bacterium]
MLNILKKINSLQVFCGGCLLILMAFLTCANIVFRQFGMPVRGTFEIMGFLGAVIFGLSLGYSHEKKEHLYVSLIFDHFPKKIKQVVQKINLFVCIVFFSLVSWQLIKKGMNLKSVGEVSETLRIAYFPFILVLSLGLAVLVLLFVYEFFKKDGEKN